MSISLVAGLGNPGRDYEKTRHNLGWVVLDALAAKHGLAWRKSSRRMEHSREQFSRNAMSLRNIAAFVSLGVAGWLVITGVISLVRNALDRSPSTKNPSWTSGGIAALISRAPFAARASSSESLAQRGR